MTTIGKIDIEKYRRVTPNITTDEVVITDERVRHIEERHPGDYELVRPFLREAINDPDFILADDKRGDTCIVLKQVEQNGLRINVVLRLHTPEDRAGFKNSVLSAWHISESRWKNYLNHKNTLYKKE